MKTDNFERINKFLQNIRSQWRVLSFSETTQAALPDLCFWTRNSFHRSGFTSSLHAPKQQKNLRTNSNSTNTIVHHEIPLHDVDTRGRNRLRLASMLSISCWIFYRLKYYQYTEHRHPAVCISLWTFRESCKFKLYFKAVDNEWLWRMSVHFLAQ